MLSPTEILKLIRHRENSHVEFKKVRIKDGSVKEPRRDSLSDEIAAFANHDGGTIIFGIDDKSNSIVEVALSDHSVLARL